MRPHTYLDTAVRVAPSTGGSDVDLLDDSSWKARDFRSRFNLVFVFIGRPKPNSYRLLVSACTELPLPLIKIS